MEYSKPIALLDANVIYPAPLRDFLLRLARAELYEAKWTNEILAEWIENLAKNRPDLTMTNLERTKALMNYHFPDAKVTGYDKLIIGLVLPDENDRHVLAAAIKAGATLIVTNNLKDFPKSKLKEHNIEAVSPDEFVQRLIIHDQHSVLMVLKDLVDSLKKPPQTRGQTLNGLENNGLKKSVRLLK